MLEIQDLRAGYRGKEVLHGLSFSFCENACILGPNGCGKTTLVRAMAGLIPSTGRVKIEGRDLQTFSRRELAMRIAVLGQMHEMYFPYTVWDTVMMGRYRHIKRRFLGVADEVDRRRVRECLERVDLWAARDRLLGELSGGQRQRAFLAQILAQDPKLILLDEPSNHLDVRFQVELIDALRLWSTQGERMVLSVFHDIHLALRLTENMVFMQDGRIVRSGHFDEVASRAFFRELYGIDLVQYMQGNLRRWQEVAP